MNATMSRVALLLLILPVTGCMDTVSRTMDAAFDLHQPYRAQSEPPQDQDSDPQASANASDIQQWWTLYDDADLNALVTHALSNNPDLNQIRARLEQAQAVTRQSQSSLLPALNLTGERKGYKGTNEPSSSFDLNGAASYELDLWGKNRATTKSSTLSEQATLEDLYAAAITLSATIVENWLDILSLVEQEELIHKQIDVNRTVLELQEKRFEMGASSALDVLQQQETLARSKAQLPDILSAQQQATNNISLLIGEMPHNLLQINTKPLPNALPIPPSGLPSNLLANRPDIIAAWLRLLSADWAAKAAFSDRLPSFDLSAIYSTSDGQISGLFDTWLLNMAISATAPVFDGGRRKAEQVRQEAIADERFQAYRQTVLTAVNDTENALVRNTYQDKKIKALQEQLAASHKTLEQAKFSYANGKSSYINVLNSLNNTQSLELQIIIEKLTQAKERVRLYRALGGRSWAQNLQTTIMQIQPIIQTEQIKDE